MAYTKSSNFAKMFCAKTPFTKNTFWGRVKNVGKKIKDTFTPEMYSGSSKTRRDLNINIDPTTGRPKRK
jgi:hypothetical protein